MIKMSQIDEQVEFSDNIDEIPGASKFPKNKHRKRNNKTVNAVIDEPLDNTTPEENEISSKPFNVKKQKTKLNEVSDSAHTDSDLVEKSPPSVNKRKEPKKRVKKSIIPVNYGEFTIENNHIYRTIYNPKKEKEEQKEVARLIRIKEIQQDIEERSVKLVLEYYYQNQLQTIPILRKQLQKSKLSELVEFGLDITDSNVVTIQQFLRLQEDYAEYKNSHKQLGWAVFEEQEVFKHHTLIGSNAESNYNGPLAVKPQGSFDAWEKTIKSEVLSSIPLTFALVAGFASPVIAWIAKDFDLEVLLIHIFGDSTMGKTTAARVFVSPFGSPTTKEGGILFKWNGTANGIIGQLVNNMGVPIAIDEASMNKMKDFTEMIYVLAEGLEKARMTKELKNRERRRWSGVLFSTAEHALMDKTNHNSGLQVRISELGNIRWTHSKEHADRIKYGLMENYGHAGVEFVDYIKKLGKDEVIKKWRKWQQKCMVSMTETDNLSDRIADKLALLLMAGELVQECFGWEMDLVGVQNLLIEQDQKKVGQRTVGDEAYRKFTEFVVQHRGKFATKDRSEKGYEYLGRVSVKNSKVEVEILPGIFRQKMTELGFENVDVILEGWRDKKYLDNDANKFTRKRSGVQPNQKRQTFICVTLPSEYTSILKEEPKVSQFQEVLYSLPAEQSEEIVKRIEEMRRESGMKEVNSMDDIS